MYHTHLGGVVAVPPETACRVGYEVVQKGFCRNRNNERHCWTASVQAHHVVCMRSHGRFASSVRMVHEVLFYTVVPQVLLLLLKMSASSVVLRQ
jgi:hypothetical protein